MNLEESPGGIVLSGLLEAPYRYRQSRVRVSLIFVASGVNLGDLTIGLGILVSIIAHLVTICKGNILLV